MALKREMLKAMGLTEEQINAIIDGHTETVTGLTNRINALEADLKGLPDLKKQLEDAKANSGDTWKSSYDDVKKQFDAYKAEVEGREELGHVKTAFKGLLEEEHVDPKRYDVIMRATRFDGMKRDKDGNLENADKLREGIRSDWADFIQTTGTKGAEVSTPPGNGGGTKLTVEEIDKIEDPGERQKAIAENHELFGF